MTSTPDAAAHPAPADSGAAAPAPRTAWLGAALRLWLRYLVPLTALAAVALAPILALAFTTRAPLDPAGVRATLGRGWTLLAIAWPAQLVLVGAAAQLVRESPSQLGALRVGLVGLARAVMPGLAVTAAVAIAGLALALPGLIALLLLAFAPASPARGLAAQLDDSARFSRAHLGAAAIVVAAWLALDAAIGVAAYRLCTVPLARPPTPAQLAGARDFVRAIAVALVATSALPAAALATLAALRRRVAR